jgi:TRAP-type C4-dicarboxylate transport system substrate-binding protein
MNPRRRAISAMIPTSAALCSLGAHAQQRTVTWRFGHVFSVPNTLFDNVAMKEYPERIARASDGLVKIEVVQGVVNPNTMLDALSDGRIQMGSIVTAASSATHPRWHVLGLPGVLDKEADYPKVAREIVWPYTDAELKRRWGATIVNMGAFTATLFFSRAQSGPVDRIEKFKGLKYRTHSVELSKLIEQMGGAPVGLPFGELYSAMERRVVDAYTSTAAAVLGNGLFEVTGFAEDWPAGLGLWHYVASEKAISALPQPVARSVMAEFAAIQKDLSERHLQEAQTGISTLGSRGVKLVQVAESEKQRVRTLAREVVWKTWLDRTGAEGRKLLSDVLSSLGKSL